MKLSISILFIVILIFAKPIVAIFTTDTLVIAQTPEALRWVFAASPIIAVQLIGAAYFQAAGKAKKALLLTLSKQGFFLIPLVLILPNFLGIFGVWIAFPIADILSTLLTGYFLKKEMHSPNLHLFHKQLHLGFSYQSVEARFYRSWHPSGRYRF